MGYISKEKLEEVAHSMRNSTYGDYLQRLVREY
jgi:dTDP-glucose pyrophosphorylase